MYPYSNVPPSDNPNQPGAYPPPPYQNPNYYQPQSYQNYNPVWRVIGIIALIWLVAAVVFGHHLFWPIVGVIIFFALFRPYRWGGYRWHYGHRHHHYRRYRYDNAPYYYPSQPQPGYYYPSQPSQPQPPTGSANWPNPADESRKDDIL